MNPESAYAKAQEYGFDGRFDDALALLEGILAADPVNADALRYKIEVLQNAEKPEEALRAADAACAILPDDVGILYQRAMLHYDGDRYPAAIADFDAVTAREPQHADALRNRAASLRLARRYKDAERRVDEALALLPDDPILLKERGWLRYDQFQYDRAADEFGRASAADPTDAQSASWQVDALSAALRYEDAIAAANAATERLAFTDSGLRTRLGAVYTELGRFDDAVREFDDVLSYEPAFEEALQGKVAALRSNRKYPAAERALEEARRLVPESLAILTEQSTLYLDRRQYDDALRIFDDILRIDEKNESAFVSKIQLLRSRRRFADAEAVAEDALKVRPDSAPLFAERAALYYDQRKFPEARAAYERALSLDPLSYPAIFGRIDWRDSRPSFLTRHTFSINSAGSACCAASWKARAVNSKR